MRIELAVAPGVTRSLHPEEAVQLSRWLDELAQHDRDSIAWKLATRIDAELARAQTAPAPLDRDEIDALLHALEARELSERSGLLGLRAALLGLIASEDPDSEAG